MRKAVFTIALAIVFVASPASATNGMRMIGFGPVQNAMGGASVAAPLDGATIVSNPAGLSALGPRVDFAGLGFVPTVEYDAKYMMPPEMSDPNVYSAGQTSDRPIDFLPTMSAVYRVDDKLTVGVAALGVAGAGVEYAQGATGLWGAKTFTSYLNGRVAPAVAYRVSDALSVGAAANVMYAQMQYEVPGATKHSAAGALGVGATVGVTFKPIDMVTLGASYESKSVFQDFAFTIDGQKQALNFDQPMVATIGAAIRPVRGLLLAVDGQWIDWSDTNGKDLPTWSKNPADEGAWNMNWSDQVVVKVGAEYQVPALEALRVRAGYNYGEAPLDPDRAFENIAFPAIAEHHLTLGAGYDLGKLTVNAAFQYSPETKLQGSNLMQQGIASYEARMSQTAFELGVTYGF